MLVLALLAAATTPQPSNGRETPVVQATATVRIVSGARLKLGERTSGTQLRQTQFRDTDGKLQPATLIEFQ